MTTNNESFDLIKPNRIGSLVLHFFSGQQQMEIFNKRLHEYIKGLDVKKQTKYTIDNNTYQKIQLVLQHQDIPVSPKFKFWAKQTFILVQIGLNHFVYNKQLNLPLITFEHLYEKISECHAVVGHSGRDKTWNEV